MLITTEFVFNQDGSSEMRLSDSDTNPLTVFKWTGTKIVVEARPQIFLSSSLQFVDIIRETKGWLQDVNRRFRPPNKLINITLVKESKIGIPHPVTGDLEYKFSANINDEGDFGGKWNPDTATVSLDARPELNYTFAEFNLFILIHQLFMISVGFTLPRIL